MKKYEVAVREYKYTNLKALGVRRVAVAEQTGGCGYRHHRAYEHHHISPPIATLFCLLVKNIIARRDKMRLHAYVTNLKFSEIPKDRYLHACRILNQGPRYTTLHYTTPAGRDRVRRDICVMHGRRRVHNRFIDWLELFFFAKHLFLK